MEVFVGIDVAKDTLEIFITPEQEKGLFEQ